MLPGNVGSLHLEALIKQLVGVFMANERKTASYFWDNCSSAISCVSAPLTATPHEYVISFDSIPGALPSKILAGIILCAECAGT